MKLKELKKKLYKLSKFQLEQDFIIIASDRTLSGLGDAKVSNSNLIYTGSKFSKLVTTKSLINDGYDKEDIKEMDVVIKKGQFYVELP